MHDNLGETHDSFNLATVLGGTNGNKNNYAFSLLSLAAVK